MAKPTLSKPTVDAAAKVDNSLISVDELLTKIIAGYGGEENLRKHKSSVMMVDVDFENQGGKQPHPG